MLQGSADAHPADWVVAGVRDFDGTVGSVVPLAFEAYVRVFHPASRGSGDSEVEVRWRDVAEANCRVMHAAAEWGSLTGSWQSHEQPGLWDQPPRTGELPEAPANRLGASLARHTSTPEHCFFALWEGYGAPKLGFLFRAGTPQDAQRRAREAVEAEVDAWDRLVTSGARFTLPQRGMWLLRGPLEAIEEFYDFHCHPPNVWWPEDHAWCVGSGIDLMTTYVGASSSCTEELLADYQLEALPVSVDQSVTWEADTINPLPPPP